MPRNACKRPYLFVHQWVCLYLSSCASVYRWCCTCIFCLSPSLPLSLSLPPSLSRSLTSLTFSLSSSLPLFLLPSFPLSLYPSLSPSLLFSLYPSLSLPVSPSLLLSRPACPLSAPLDPPHPTPSLVLHAHVTYSMTSTPPASSGTSPRAINAKHPSPQEITASSPASLRPKVCRFSSLSPPLFSLLIFLSFNSVPSSPFAFHFPLSDFVHCRPLSNSFALLVFFIHVSAGIKEGCRRRRQG